jgi:uncharacterized protein
LSALLPHDILAGAAVGLIGGFTSGLLGISPGGGLVVFATLLLGVEQHIAQGISLAAQVPPTSLGGIKRYWDSGNRSPVRWLVLLAIGFVAGGPVGAVLAGNLSNRFLQWSYVAYLVLLGALIIVRRRGSRQDEEIPDAPAKPVHWAALIAVGFVAGWSSGLLGIGGGLAIVAGLTAGLKVRQHHAQMMSLVLSTIPTTIPATYVYWRHGWLGSWPVLGAVVVGLWVGTDLGARMANRVGQTALRRSLIVMVAAMATYMAWRALT